MTYEIGSAEAEGQNVLHAKNKLASCQWHRPFLFLKNSDSDYVEQSFSPSSSAGSGLDAILAEAGLNSF